MHLGTRFLIGTASVVLAALSMFSLGFFDRFSNVAQGTSAPVSVASTSKQEAVKTPAALPVPKIVSIIPKDGSNDVTLDIEDPIEVNFDASTKDFFVDFRLDPPVAVTYENNPEKTRFKLLPKEPLLLGTSYALNVFIKPRGAEDKEYARLSSSTFVTLKEKLTEAQQTVADKLAAAKRDTVPQITQGRYIDVTLASQVMVLFEDGRPVDAYQVSSGKRGMDTPKGRFKIENKMKRVWSKTYGLYMPYWMAITPSGKFGIHELPEWPSGYKEGASHLGRPVSHGCVRLGVGPAQRTWEWAEVGTPVIVH